MRIVILYFLDMAGTGLFSSDLVISIYDHQIIDAVYDLIVIILFIRLAMYDYNNINTENE